MDSLHLSDQELLTKIELVMGSRRRLTVELVGYLGEIEERRLHWRRAHGSMFEYCTVELRMSEGEAFRHIAGARLCRRFPLISTFLADGRIHLSGLVMLRDLLTEQ